MRNQSLLMLAVLASSCATSRKQPSRTDGGTDANNTTDRTTAAAEMNGEETDNSSTEDVGSNAPDGAADSGAASCFLPRQNQDLNYQTAQGCACNSDADGGAPVCVATALGELVTLACEDGFWVAQTALDAGSCDPDLAGTPCYDEPLTCVGLVGYYCKDLDAWNEGEEVTPTWALDPTLTCPMLSEEECWDIEAELGAVIAADNSCQSDEDCNILGGVEQACDCTPFLNAYAYSLQADYTPIGELYNRLVDGTCAMPICDAAPQEVACIQGSCELVGSGSCFEGDEYPPDGGFVDVGFLDAGVDAGAVDAGAVDAGVDAGAVDAAPPDAG